MTTLAEVNKIQADWIVIQTNDPELLRFYGSIGFKIQDDKAVMSKIELNTLVNPTGYPKYFSDRRKRNKKDLKKVY